MHIDIDTAWKILGVAFACGVLYDELKAIRKDIKRLEEKQDKYNTLQERTLKLEVWRDQVCQNSGTQANKD